MASILRIRQGTSFLPNIKSQYPNGEEDLLDVTACRTVPSITSSEVVAISLGIKRALRIIPSSWRKQVLILSDSEYAIDFFCGSEYTFNNDNTPPILRVGNNKRKKRKGTASSTKGRKQIAKSMEEGHRRSLLAFMKDSPNSILFAKIKSSSRGIAIASGSTADGQGQEADSIPWDGIGFIDHNAADHLSSITRSFANTYDDKTKIDVMEDPPFRAVKPLEREDLAWLKNSENNRTALAENNEEKESTNGFFQSIDVVGSDARHDRKKRYQRRTEIIQEMLGLNGS